VGAAPGHLPFRAPALTRKPRYFFVTLLARLLPQRPQAVLSRAGDRKGTPMGLQRRVERASRRAGLDLDPHCSSRPRRLMRRATSRSSNVRTGPGLTFRTSRPRQRLGLRDVRLADGTERAYMVTCACTERGPALLGSCGPRLHTRRRPVRARAMDTLHCRHSGRWLGLTSGGRRNRSTANGQWHAYVWRDGVMQPLDDGGADDSVAVDIGDSGRILAPCANGTEPPISLSGTRGV